MSKIALSGNASGTGTFTIASPDSNSDRTLDLPDAAGTIQVSGNPISGTTGSFSGDLSFNSGYGSAAVAYGCRAWVNFDGTGTPAIRGSGNVSSLVDNGTGDYTVNFATAMPDANYSVVMSGSREPSSGGGSFCQNIATDNLNGTNIAPTTTAIRLTTNRGSGLGPVDVSYVTASIFR
jgi:hypothetical protein